MRHGIIQKRLSALLALLTAATSLTGLTSCHGSRGLDSFVMPEEFDTTREHVITFWAKNDTNKAQTRIYEQAIADFHDLYPNVTVELRLYTDYSRIYNDVITNISTGTTPNVCITYPDHIATYMTGVNVVVPLDELMHDSRYGLGGSEVRFDSPSADEVIPQFLGECVLDEMQYALPFMRSTEACYINKTYVEALGYTLPDVLTWDFVWEVSETATAKNEDGTYRLNGQNVMLPFIYKSTDNMMIQLLRQSGADYSTDEGDVLLFNDTTRDFLYTVASHAKSGAFSTFKISSYPANFLNAGQCVFAIDSTAGSTWMGTDAPLSDMCQEDLVQFEIAVRMIPQIDPTSPRMISQGPSVCLFNKADPQEVLASWLFMQFLLTNEVQVAYAGTEGYVPVTTKARQSAEYTDYLSRSGEDNEHYYSVKLDVTRLLLEHTDDTFVTSVFNGSASLRSAAGQLIENVTKSVRRSEEINEEYMDKLCGDVTSLYRLDSLGNDSVSGKAELGPLPTTSVVLLSSLGIIWLCIAAYVIRERLRSRTGEKTGKTE